MEEIVGGLCVSGFVIEDLREPKRADYNVDVSHFGYRGRFVPPYVRMKARRVARKISDSTQESNGFKIWIPGSPGL
jgi:hypothetical protein